MTRSSRYVLIAILLIAILGVGGFFGYNYLRQNQPASTETTPDPEQTTATGDVPQTIEEPEVEDNSFITEPETEGTQASNPTVDNSDVTETLQAPEKMQQVIEQNKADVNNQQIVDQLAPSYPTDLVPVFKAKTAADSADIITTNGKPGWTATYGSDASIADITKFYSDLYSGQDGYSNEQVGESNNIKAIVDNCTIDINISPNNVEQTGLNDKTNVSIFIERN